MPILVRLSTDHQLRVLLYMVELKCAHPDRSTSSNYGDTAGMHCRTEQCRLR